MSHSDDCLRVTDRGLLEKVAARAAAAGTPQLPLFAAAAAGFIGLVTLDGHQADWQARDVARISRPIVVLVGDDPYPHAEAVGPDGWVCSRRLKYWAAAAIVHGTGPHPDHYRTAVEAALLKQRIVLVETASVYVDAWSDLFKPLPVLAIKPPPGRVHPNPAMRVLQ